MIIIWEKNALNQQIHHVNLSLSFSFFSTFFLHLLVILLFLIPRILFVLCKLSYCTN